MSATWLANSTVPIADRQQVVSEVRRSLSSNYLFGSVVVGKPGVGKSSLLQEVLEDEAVGAHVVHLRGTVLSASKPLSALAFLLNELGISADQDPQMVAESLARHFNEKANGGQTVVVVDNADSLDVDSADIVAQLALDRSVRLLIACRDLTRSPSSLMTLWLEGALLRIDLDKLSLFEARRLLARAVRAKLSRSAVHALWEYSAGNARLMQLLIHDFIGSGKITRHGDIYVLGRGSLRVSQPTADAVLAHLGPLTDQQISLLEMLSLAGHMPLAMASDLGRVEDLDRLHAIGAIIFSQDTHHLVRADRLVAAVVRGRVGPFRRVGHLARIKETHSSPGAPPIHPVRYAEWTLECGLPLDADVGLYAASVANDHDDPETALKIVAGISGDNSTHLPLLLETANAHLRTDDETSAARLMRTFLAAASTQFSGAELKRLEIPEDGAVRVQLEIARSILTGHGHPPTRPAFSTPKPAPGEGEVLLAAVERAAGEGRHDVVRSLLEGQQGQQNVHCPEVEIQLQGLLALAHAVTDRQHDALNLAERIVSSAQSLPLPEQIRACLAFRLQLIFLITGRHGDGSSLVAQNRYSLSGDGTAGELMEGLELAHHGQADEALELLVPAFAQLQVWDPVGLRCVSAAATAYCHALQGNLAKASSLMLPLQGAERATPTRQPLFAVHYFRALTLALLGSTAEALDNLRELAEEEFKAGHFGLELLARAALVRLGDRSAAAALLDTARRTQGPFSDVCSLFANGLTGKDPELLLKAVHMAESMDHQLLAAEITEAARAMAVSSGDRVLMRQVQRVIVNSSSYEEDTDIERRLNLLTPREEEVARLAKAGMSNKEMAGRMQVSVRTVEGHLYQIYVKLGVNSRSDLLDALEN